MEFLVKEIIKLRWYYSPLEMAHEANKERQVNNLPLCSEDLIKNMIEFIKIGNEYLKIESSAGSYYCMKEKKQALSFDVPLEQVELIKFQLHGLFNYMIEQAGKGQKVIYNDIVNQATYIEKYYNTSQYVDKLEEKYTEKTKASIQKPKKI